MQIRAATGRELEVVLAQRLAFLAEIRSVDVSSFDEDFVASTWEFLADASERERLHSWLAIDGDDVVGVASVLANDAPPLPEEPGTREGYLVNVFVAPRARRRGVGGSLVGAAVDAAPTLGLRRLYLHTTEQGRPLYAAAGFVPDQRWMGLPLRRLS